MVDLEYDRELSQAVLLNESGLPDEEIHNALQSHHPDLAAALTRWQSNLQGRSRGLAGGGRIQTLFDRDRYLVPDKMFDKFKVATDAAEHDDVVSGVVETTEQLAFKRIALETPNESEQSVWQQIADEIDLSQRLREIWRELFILSQCYVAVLYGRKDFKAKGKTRRGNKARKEYSKLLVPKAISLLDPLKVIPVGDFLFNQEKLVYIADRDEAANFDETLADKNSADLIVKQLFVGRYTSSSPARLKREQQSIQEVTGIQDVKNLFLLNPERVFRITATRASYRRFAAVRMESVFELLDLKHQLRQMDRVSLIGNTNAIILVKKGSDHMPAKPPEIEALATQIKGTARQPIIVGDHRIEIEIITPKTDKTLAAERYNAIDARITARLYQILASGNYAAGTATDNSAGLMRVVSSSMEARRDNIRDLIMNNIFTPTWQKNDILEDEPKMTFYPRRIALDFDPTIADYIQTLRDRGDLSRETALAELDILEEDEAVKRKREAELYDDIFTPPNNVPFDSPNHPGPTGQPGQPNQQGRPMTPAEQKNAGRTGGGNNNGGGRNPKSNQPTNTKK